MKKGIYEILSRSPVFKGMKPLDIEEILKRIQHRMIKYKKGNIIAFRGDQCEKLLVLMEGDVINIERQENTVAIRETATHLADYSDGTTGGGLNLVCNGGRLDKSCEEGEELPFSR